jgi:hypothetical protein
MIEKRTVVVKFNLTDRAKRYRANRKGTRPGPPKQCGFCGSRKNVGVHHITGDEDDGAPADLMWACKSCNSSIAVVMKNAGVGKRTRQFNPGGSKRSRLDAYGAAIKVMRGEFEGDVGRAIGVIRSTPPSLRSEFTSRTWPVRRSIYGPSGRQSDLPF